MEHDAGSWLWSSADSGLPGDPNARQASEPEQAQQSGDPGAPEAARTGEPRVDEALRGLAALGDLPVAEHPAVYERIHGELAEVLSGLRPGSGPATGRGADG